MELPFAEGRMIFMLRCRMFPTRMNFPGRWSNDLCCLYCGKPDTDEHLFKCWGFIDLTLNENMEYKMFLRLNVPKEELSRGARILLKIYERLLMAQED